MKRSTEGHEQYSRRDVYQLITDRVLDALEHGTVPWRQTWRGGEAPTNLISRKPYRGVNVFILGCAAHSSPYWVTFKQAKDLGGHVRKGEKGSPVVFWKWLDRKGRSEGDEQEGSRSDQVAFLRYFTVFNVEQCEGLEKHLPAPIEKPAPVDPIASAQKIIDAMPRPPHVLHGGGVACYSPSIDTVKLPHLDDFDNAEAYYSTLFHELAHSTGHVDRLNRHTLPDACVFGSTNYSKEELLAEIAAAFLCATAGIADSVIENQAAYVQGWLRRLSDDRKLIVQAAAQAQHAADFILGEQPATAGDDEEQGESEAEVEPVSMGREIVAA